MCLIGIWFCFQIFRYKGVVDYIRYMISVKKWERDMRTLDEGAKVENLVIGKSIEKPAEMIYDLRRAAECHKIVRRNIQEYVKPGLKLLDICERVENNVVEVFGRNDMSAGIAFPTGMSVNNVIAHQTCDSGDPRVLGVDDLLKLDFGTHVNGYIIDSAFSVAFNEEYQPLLDAAQDAVWTAIKMSGVDASIYDISKGIKEVIESYEVTIKGKTYPLKPIRDLGGHSIGRYRVHSDQIILCAPYESEEYKGSRMREGQYAIECFPSSGSGKMFKSRSKVTDHYMASGEVLDNYRGKLKTIQGVYNWIKKNRGTLAFTPRWLEKDGVKGYKIGLNEFSRRVNPPIITEYPPLEDIPGSYVSQYEHTIYVHENGTEVLSAGDDY